MYCEIQVKFCFQQLESVTCYVGVAVVIQVIEGSAWSWFVEGL